MKTNLNDPTDSCETVFGYPRSIKKDFGLKNVEGGFFIRSPENYNYNFLYLLKGFLFLFGLLTFLIDNWIKLVLNDSFLFLFCFCLNLSRFKDHSL